MVLVILPVLVMLNACQKDDTPEINQENEAFYKEMKDWYFWTDKIPEINPSSYPSIFDVLEAIRYREVDRWSFIADWDELIAYISNTEFIGYGFGFLWDNEEKLRISHIYNTVPMHELGVRRGWIIEAINGTTINPGDNISAMLGEAEPGVSNTFRFIRPDGETVSLTLEKEVLSVNTVLHHEIIEVENIKTGYMVLQNFTGTTTQELKDIFQYFHQEQIDELILDMRYNGGGLTSVALQLASLIGGTELEGEPFAKYYYNTNKQDRNTIEYFTDEANSLGLDRLITICTGATASASEMVINGLRPYMDVVIVGANSYGKPMGADILQFNTIWAVAPITISVKNADDEGEFFDGLPVNVPANDGLAYDFGDPEEASLQHALSFIISGITKGEPVQEPLYRQPYQDMKGLRQWIGGY